MAAKRGVFTPKETMVIEYEGHPVTLHAGMTRIREGHPMMKGRQALFVPVRESVDFEVEQATAAPGEKRGADSAEKAK